MQLDDYPRAGLDGSVYLSVVSGVGYECAAGVDVFEQPVKVRRDDGSFEKIPSSESETPCVRRYSAFRRGLKTLERACGGSIRSMLLSEKARQNHVAQADKLKQQISYGGGIPPRDSKKWTTASGGT